MNYSNIKYETTDDPPLQKLLLHLAIPNITIDSHVIQKLFSCICPRTISGLLLKIMQ